ncbi:MAG: hypothetical protein VW547_00135 [Alphaproteobacteria bacterium]
MYLFIVRRYNDIDHIAPIVWKMAESGDGPLAVLCTTPHYDVDGDFRLRHLAERYGVRHGHAGAESACSIGHRLVNRALERMRRTGNTNGALWRNLVRRQMDYCTADWARRLLEEWDVKTIVFDWCKPDGRLAAPIVESAVALGIPMLAVPHGVNYMTNDLRSTKAVKSGIPALWGEYLRRMDHVVVQHRRHGEWMVRSGVEVEKILVMGSTRFCGEWCAVYNRIVPPVPVLSQARGDGRLRIVYMDHNEVYRLDVEAIDDGLLALAEREDVDLAIKSGAAHNRYRYPRLRALGEQGDAMHSNALIDWADVVMGTTSSILLEAFLRGKALLYPRYFHENGQLFDEMGACLPVDNLEQLMAAVSRLHNAPDVLPYPETNVTAFLTEVIYGGKPDRDVLGEHREAVIAAAEGRLFQGANWEPVFHRLAAAGE